MGQICNSTGTPNASIDCDCHRKHIGAREPASDIANGRSSRDPLWICASHEAPPRLVRLDIGEIVRGIIQYTHIIWLMEFSRGDPTSRHFRHFSRTPANSS